MKRIFTFALVLLICTACFASCAQVEQKIGEVVSVAAVEAAAEELAKQGVEYEVADEAALAEIEAEIVGALESDLQGKVTAAVAGTYTNAQTGDWTTYWTYGFSSAADAEAYVQVVTKGYQELIDQGKAIVVNGGYIVSVTASSMVIEQE